MDCIILDCKEDMCWVDTAQIDEQCRYSQKKALNYAPGI